MWRKIRNKWALIGGLATLLGLLGIWCAITPDKEKKSLKSQIVFTKLIDLKHTDVKDQGASNTCWAYTGNSFLESEMMRMGKQSVALSQIYTARTSYFERARNYVRLHGGLLLGEGGQLLDVMNVLRDHGAMPAKVYTGLKSGNKRNNFKPMRSVLNGTLNVMVKSRSIKPYWEQAINDVMDNYLGKVPTYFQYKNKSYTTRTFADEVVGIDPDNYINIASVTDKPYYKKFVFMIPDNWSFNLFVNIPMEELTDIVDHALQNGFTLACTLDISEIGFSWQHGIAFVPQNLSKTERDSMFLKPQREPIVTAQMRQRAFDLWQTTDDHALHIVGLAKDQNGKQYYLAKNSWGTANAFRGYIYITKEYLRYKVTALMLHRDALKPHLKIKMGGYPSPPES